MSISREFVPQDMQGHILSFFDTFKDLNNARTVSTAWRQMASSDALWSKLFIKCFNEESPQKSEHREVFRKRIEALSFPEKFNLERFILKFLCQPKLDKKRELICLFPDTPNHFLRLQQGFGSRGTVEGFNGVADEVEYCKSVEHSLTEPHADEDVIFDDQDSLECPGGWYDPLTGKGFPAEEKGIPLFNLRSFTLGTSISSQFIRGKVESVDVGDGNTLGYLSSMDNWTSFFPLFCIPGKNGQPIWTGIFPCGARFLFALKNSQGELTLEKRETENESLKEKDSRCLQIDPVDESHGFYLVRDNLRKCPIEFADKLK